LLFTVCLVTDERIFWSYFPQMSQSEESPTAPLDPHEPNGVHSQFQNEPRSLKQEGVDFDRSKNPQPESTDCRPQPQLQNTEANCADHLAPMFGASVRLKPSHNSEGEEPKINCLVAPETPDQLCGFEDNMLEDTAESIMPRHFGHTPTQMVCPNCLAEITTQIEVETSMLQHFACFVIFVVSGLSGALFCACCSLMPYCFRTCGNTRHECPDCHTYLGSGGRYGTCIPGGPKVMSYFRGWEKPLPPVGYDFGPIML
jgi:hypothetical protein